MSHRNIGLKEEVLLCRGLINIGRGFCVLVKESLFFATGRILHQYGTSVAQAKDMSA
jgi:hypothetical protein